MEINPKNENQFTYFRYFFSILRFKMLVAIVLNIAIGFLDGIGLTMLFPLLQSVEAGSSTNQSLGQLKYVVSFFEEIGIPLTINVIMLIFLALFLLKAMAKYAATIYQVKLQLFFFKKIQLQVSKNFRQMSYRGYLQMDGGRVQNTMIAEVWRVAEAMRVYLKWSNSVFLVLTYVVLAYLANAKFAFLITVGVGLFNLFYRGYFKKIRKASYEISSKGEDFSGYLTELIHYFKYLKSTNNISFFSERLHSVINQRLALDYKVGKLGALITSIKEPTVILVVVTVIFIQVNYIGGGIGSIILSLLLFYRGLNNLMNLQGDWQNFLRMSGGFRIVSEVTNQMKSFKEVSGSVTFQTFRKEIRLENVDLSFGKSKILNQINLVIPKNTTVALTGVSGSGKTTLVNLISGLLRPDKGEIFIDNLPIRELELGSYRSKIGYISQEPVVFNDTIYNNITFWAEPTEENKKRFWEVVEMSSLTQFIEEQELNEHARLGDNGILISGGQRQRISIARELFKKPEILILDEATSALDSETERIIQENIESLHGHYTMIIIAHRLSTIKHVDEIYLLEKGKIVHSGNFNEMLENSPSFKSLVSLQGL